MKATFAHVKLDCMSGEVEITNAVRHALKYTDIVIVALSLNESRQQAWTGIFVGSNILGIALERKQSSFYKKDIAESRRLGVVAFNAGYREDGVVAGYFRNIFAESHDVLELTPVPTE